MEKYVFQPTQPHIHRLVSPKNISKLMEFDAEENRVPRYPKIQGHSAIANLVDN